MSIEPQFRFCTSADGARLAYAIYGSGPPLLHLGPMYYVMEALFAVPESRAYLDALAARVTLVMFDWRGAGASTRDVDDVSQETEALDIAAVADAAGLREFTLFAHGVPAQACARYFVAHSDRVKQLIFWQPLFNPSALREIARQCREDWSLARRLFFGHEFPDGPVSLQRAFSLAIKSSISLEVFARYVETNFSDDREALFPMIVAPAVVLLRERWPRHESMRMAALMPNSQVQLVRGAGYGLFPEHAPVVEAVFEFMGLSEPTIGPAGAFRTILFTDLVGHTEMMSRLGDERGRNVLREHERITREVLKANGGTEVKTMGDGFMASFGSVTKAVECAVALQRAFADRDGEPLSVRVGLNAGEPIEEDGDLFGATVILASRIAAKAEGGEILVADTVRGLCSGKGFLFSDRGEFVAKGIEEPVRISEVKWEAS